ncbi:MAG TPA: hypothetical protein VG675_02010 [Bryobacteraceae bacterium]|nr:hypothetical protein [Bryobacteraceae bacterium]
MRTTRCCVLLAAALACVAAFAQAQTFTFEIAGPVAAHDFRVKSAVFVFRTIGCPEPAKSEIAATGEGLVDGNRRSMVLRAVATSKPGVYGILRQWGEGKWAVILNGSCGDAHASAIVPIGHSGFVREASRFYTHAPTAAEIEAVMKAFPEKGYK